MQVVALIIFAYIFVSLILPLRWPWKRKFLAAGTLFVIAQKNLIFQLIGGGLFFAPELPRPVLIIGGAAFAMLLLVFLMLPFKDLLWLGFRIFRKAFPREKASAIVVCLAAVFTIYGTFGAVSVPVVRTQEIVLERLPKSLDGTKIALLADLHLSAQNQAEFAQAVVEKTNALSPDLILVAGDFVDGSVKNRRDDVAPLANLSAKCGVFGVLGNHEYYSGRAEWLDEFRWLGIKILINENVQLDIGGNAFAVAGLDDVAGTQFGFKPDLGRALSGISAGTLPIVLLAHQPKTALENTLCGNVDLQLSGHTHGGMILGLDLIIAKFNGGFVRGLYEIGEMQLYVSAGTSLWNGFPLRIGTRSEITEIILRSPLAE